MLQLACHTYFLKGVQLLNCANLLLKNGFLLIESCVLCIYLFVMVISITVSVQLVVIQI